VEELVLRARDGDLDAYARLVRRFREIALDQARRITGDYHRAEDAVQEAFVENDAQQCGFCTPGFVVACTSVLDKNPDATLEEAQAGCGGNLCRCGTYVGMNQALMDAAKSLKGGA